MVDAVAGADGSRAFPERVPGDSETRSKIVLRDLNYILPEWRNGRRAIKGRRAGGIILRVDDYSVAAVAGPSDAVTRAGNLLGRGCGEERGIVIRQAPT